MKQFTCLVHSLGFARSCAGVVVNVWNVSAEVPAACPEILFEKTNAPFDVPAAEAVTDNQAYALSVGDVVEVAKEGRWLCAPSGWLTLSEADFREYKARLARLTNESGVFAHGRPQSVARDFCKEIEERGLLASAEAMEQAQVSGAMGAIDYAAEVF